MLALSFALAAVLVSGFVGLGRQIVVFTVFEPGLWLFRRYRAKRRIGLACAGTLAGAAVLARPGPVALALVATTGALSVLALVFNLDRLFPALHAVRVAAVEGGPASGPERTLGAQAHVVVVEIGEERRAYPLERMVMPRHLVHDVVGAVPIVVTYCAICRSGLVFRAEQQGRRLLFEVAGVFRRNLIVEDSQTHTLWQQATGDAIHGPLTGGTLEMLSSVQMPWRRARQMSGMTLALDPDGAPFAVLSTRLGFRLLDRVTSRVSVPGRTRLSPALARRAPVFGVRVGGQAKAYPLSEVRSAGPFTDTVGGVDLDVAYDASAETLRVRRRDGRPPPVVERHGGLGWNEFHPDTAVYRRQEPAPSEPPSTERWRPPDAR